MISVSRQDSYARHWRSVLPAVLAIVFLFWVPASAVADVNAKVEAFIKARGFNDTNAKFLDIYESLEGDRTKIAKALMQHGFTCAKDIIVKAPDGKPDILCFRVVCKKFGLGGRSLAASVKKFSRFDRGRSGRTDGRIFFYRRGTDRVAAGWRSVRGLLPICPGKSRQGAFFRSAPDRWEILK